jgi:hypothetical protein
MKTLLALVLGLALTAPLLARDDAATEARFAALHGIQPATNLNGKMLTGWVGTARVNLRVTGQRVTGYIGTRHVMWRWSGYTITGPFEGQWVNLRVNGWRVTGWISGRFVTLSVG